jgi:hypothetical protein
MPNESHGRVWARWVARASCAAILTALTSCAPPQSTTSTSTSSTGAEYTYSGGFPTPETVQRAKDEADLNRAITSYRFWYPAVSVEGMFNGFAQTGIKVNESMSVLSAGPRQIAYTANSDTPYGAGAFDVSAGPIVVELPPGPFIALATDHYQGWIMDMGLPGPDAGKGGKHLILPPGYKGTPPAGYYVGRSTSNRILIAIRSIPLDGNLATAMDALRRIQVYPLSSAQHPTLITYLDTSQQAMDATPLTWEDNIAYWQKLHDIVDSEPLNDSFGPMYGLLTELGIGKGQPFQPDERMKGILERAAKMARAQMMATSFASSRAERLAWSDRKWEWLGLVPNVDGFQTANGLDTDARDRWFIQATLTSPAMFRRTEGAGSLYWLGARDATGAFLDGGKSYKLSVPLPVPGKLFWSVTVYDTETRSEIKTDQDKAALRSLVELKDVTGASTDLYFGPNPPAGHDGQWIKTTPGKGWFSYFRIYGPQGPAFDGSWKPGDFEEVK